MNLYHHWVLLKHDVFDHTFVSYHVHTIDVVSMFPFTTHKKHCKVMSWLINTQKDIPPCWQTERATTEVPQTDIVKEDDTLINIYF